MSDDKQEGGTPRTDDLLIECPKCGGEIYIYHHESTFAIPECVIPRCMDCEWEGEPN